MRVYTDFKSPAAYLALAPTLALADQYNVVIEWRGYASKQSPIPQRVAHEDKGATHRRVRAQARQAMHTHYAQLAGLKLKFRRHAGSTDLALLALEALAIDQRTPFVQSCFAAYWEKGEDLDDADVIAELLQRSVGVNHFELSNSQKAHTLNETAVELDGIVDVPAYVVAGQLFIGREHLPWIAQLCQTVVDG